MTIARPSTRQATLFVLSALLLASAVLFYGAFGSHAAAQAVSIRSSNANPATAKVGDTVTLSFTTPAGSAMPAVSIDGNAATLSGGPTAWTATRTLAATDPAGAVTFAITSPDGSVTTTSDSSYVTFYAANPIASLISAKAVPNTATSLTSLPIVVYFSEPVRNIALMTTAFTAVNARVTMIQSISHNQVFVVTLVPDTSATAPFSITLPSGAALDPAGNTTGSATLSFIYDPSAPAETTARNNSVTTSGTMTATSGAMGGSMTDTSATSMGTMPMAASGGISASSSDLISTSSILLGSSTGMGTSTSSTTTSTSSAVWLGIVIILILLIGGGWWYSRNVGPTT